MASKDNLPVRNKSHGKQASTDERRRVAMPRRSTRGPLDTAEPLPSPSAPPSAAELAPPTPAINTELPPSSNAEQSKDKSAISPVVPTNRLPSPGAPRIDLSFLLRPTLYNPMPARDVATPFLKSKHQPAPDHDLDYLLSHGHFRLAAARAADDLTSGNVSPFDHETILSLYHIRLSCLMLISHPEFAAQESRPLIEWLGRNAALPRSQQRDQQVDTQLIPWNLRLLLQRLHTIGLGDGRRGIMGLYTLATECRNSAASAASKGANDEVAIWTARLADLGIRVAGELVEMGELEAALRHLDSLDESPGSDPHMAMRKALLYLRVGDLTGAKHSLASLDDETAQKKVLAALVKLADGEYDAATASFAELYSDDTDDQLVAINYAVCLLYSGRLQEGNEVLESQVQNGQSSSELLFNLATMYELRTDRAAEKKLGLAQQVADFGPTERGWERSGAEFKL